MIIQLTRFLDDFSDEIPEEEVIEGNHKVRSTWFQGALSTSKFALRAHLSNPELWEKVIEFEKRLTARRAVTLEAMDRGEAPSSFTPTTREEIDTMNELLREVRENLKAV